MERQYISKLGYWADKLAVKAEPSLSTSQLMLINKDLKPSTAFSDEFYA